MTDGISRVYDVKDNTRCISRVFRVYEFFSHQCSRKRGHGPDGLYCKQHAKIEEARRCQKT